MASCIGVGVVLRRYAVALRDGRQGKVLEICGSSDPFPYMSLWHSPLGPWTGTVNI